MQPTISTCCFSMAFLLSSALNSQADNLFAFIPDSGAAPAKKIFLRLYNQERDRVGDGYLLYGNDTMIMLSKRGSIRKYPVSSVTYIKTRHQRVRDIAIGAGVATAFLAVAWATTDREDQRLFLPPIGTSTGGAASMTIRRRTLWIYRDKENWKALRKLFFQP